MDRSDLQRWRLIGELDRWLRWPMIMLAFVWLAIVVVDLTSGTTPFLEAVSTVIWVIFIVEFAVRLLIAPAKGEFLRHNWLTLLALVVPALRLFRAFAILRAARALRALRLVRIVGTANRSMRALRVSLERRRVGYVTGLTLLVVFLGAAGMWSLESAREVPGGFDDYADALWWTAMLLTTIGSAYWPVTDEGRLLGLLLSIYGLGVFGYITAILASFFVGRDAEDSGGPVAGNKELRALRAEIAALRTELSAGSAARPRRDQAAPG
jgi:voltage-gated potassium channel